jgi:hypothetical protein
MGSLGEAVEFEKYLKGMKNRSFIRSKFSPNTLSIADMTSKIVQLNSGMFACPDEIGKSSHPDFARVSEQSLLDSRAF